MQLSYTNCREIIKDLIKKIGLDQRQYSTHSCRAGGASDLAPHVTHFELMMTGRWNDERSINNYVEVPEANRVEVNKILNLNLSSSGRDDKI